MSERRITAAKPARLRRDVAGFGPVPAQPRPVPEPAPAPEAPVVRVVLVPAEEELEDESDRASRAERSLPDWRTW